jgi:hypothetical protein
MTKKKYRSQEWFNNPDNPGMTALYLERYLNFGLTRKELQSGKPVIGIAQTGNVGDGKIFITEISKVVRVRTGETNEQVL